MAKRTRYAEYQDRYANFAFELTDDGILFMQCHTNGDSLVWSWEAHDGMSDVFADIAGDREIKVLIHTGTGENYNANWGAAPGGSTVKPIYLAMEGQEGLMQLDEKAWYGRMLVENVLAVDVPIISAVNGPCSIHSEVPLLSDIVLASDTAYFQDLAHFPRGLVPGDGSHVLWAMLVGPNRARSMLLMGKKLGAQEALDWGVVAEVLPPDQLVDRARGRSRASSCSGHRSCCATRDSCSCRASSGRFSTNSVMASRARPTPSVSSSPRAAGCGASTARGTRNPGPTEGGRESRRVCLRSVGSPRGSSIASASGRRTSRRACATLASRAAHARGPRPRPRSRRRPTRGRARGVRDRCREEDRGSPMPAVRPMPRAREAARGATRPAARSARDPSAPRARGGGVVRPARSR